MMQNPRNSARMKTELARKAVPKIAPRLNTSGQPSWGIRCQSRDCESVSLPPADRTAPADVALLPSQPSRPYGVVDGLRVPSVRGADGRRGEAASRATRRYRQRGTG